MRRLVLLGGGHAHVGVLADLARAPLTGWDVHLVTPYRRQIYSGMLPGWLAGHYPIDACALALDTLAAKAGVTLHQTAGTALDPAGNTLRCLDGSKLRFDFLSIATGPVPSLEAIAGAAEHALPIRPIEGFIAAWPDLLGAIACRPERFELVVVGSGAAGIELALAIQWRAHLLSRRQLRVSLVGPDNLPLDGAPTSMRRSLVDFLRRRGIDWIANRRVVAVAPGQIDFEGGGTKECDACLIATGAAAPKWAASAGLDTDAEGFIRVGPGLQSLSHPHIFAAGDVASYHRSRPKSGVYAVRAGPLLAHNLRAAGQGRPLRNWQPQARALYLISTGDRHAFGVWAGLWWRGNWAWRWKDRIDRRFMRRFGTKV